MNGPDVPSATAGEDRTRTRSLPSRRLRKINQRTPAVKRMYANSATDPTKSVAGLIAGSKSDSGVIDLTTLIEGAWAGERAPELEVSLRQLLKRAEAGGLKPGEEIVGWYVTKAGSAGIADEELLGVHRSLFPGWWQVALLVDPSSLQFGIYGRRDGELCRLGGRKEAVESRPRSSSPNPSALRATPPSRDRSSEGRLPSLRSRQRPASEPGPSSWDFRIAVAVPLCAGLVGGIVLAVLR